MGRPLNFGNRINKEQPHTDPEVGDKLQQLEIGDIVRFDVEEKRELIFTSDMINYEVEILQEPLTLQRQASTYGLAQIMFNKNENYIVANRYNRNVGGKELEMMILFPLSHGSNSNINGNGNGILTWLVDLSGWVRIAEDFGILQNITNVTVINKIQLDCPIYNLLNDISIDKDGMNRESGSTIFYPNDICINWRSIHIPFM